MSFLYLLQNKALPIAQRYTIEKLVDQGNQDPYVIELKEEINNPRCQKYSLIFSCQEKIKYFIKEIEESQKIQKQLNIDKYVIFGNVFLIYLRKNHGLSDFARIINEFLQNQPEFMFVMDVTFPMIQDKVIQGRKQRKLQFFIHWHQKSQDIKRSQIQNTLIEDESIDVESRSRSRNNSKEKNKPTKEEEVVTLSKQFLESNPRELIQQIVEYQKKLKNKVKKVEQMYKTYFSMVDETKDRINKMKASYEKEKMNKIIQQIQEP